MSLFIDAMLAEVPTGLLDRSELTEALRAWVDGPGKCVLKFSSTVTDFVTYAVRQAFLPTSTPRSPETSQREAGVPYKALGNRTCHKTQEEPTPNRIKNHLAVSRGKLGALLVQMA